MENIETVGSLLRRERESKKLSLQDVMDATKITIHNLSALEEDRFDYFPNRVYTRAFLRDYANYLGLDSAELLDKYEQTWGSAKDTAASAPVRRRSGWRLAAGVVTVLVVLGALGAAGYVYMNGRGLDLSSMRPVQGTTQDGPGDVATLPRVPVVPTPEPEKPSEKPVEAPKPTVMVRPEEMTVQVQVLKPVVYVGAAVDGGKSEGTNQKQGDTLVFKGKKTIRLTVGIADGVQVKWNGVVQPSLGTAKDVGRALYKMEESPMVAKPVDAATAQGDNGETGTPVPAEPAGRTQSATPAQPTNP